MLDFALINWPAVLTGTVAAFLLGWLVYSPMLFGRTWAAGTGIQLSEGSKPPAMAMALQLAALFLLALIIGLTETGNQIGAAIIAILAVAAMVMANGAFSQKSGAAIAIDGGYALGSGVVMILAQALL